MTDPTGRSFLSYCRSRADEACLLVVAQHDHGIPTWQDTEDLDEKPTEEELRRVLQNETIANAILWITPEVGDSNYIRAIEAPAILERARAKDSFFVTPCVAGSLGYEEAASKLRSRFTLEDLRHWNMIKVGVDPIGTTEAANIAHRVLRRRLSALHRELPKSEPFRLSLYTRVPPAADNGAALQLDWSRRFNGRHAEPDAWEEFLLPALSSVVKLLRTQAPGRHIEAGGFCSISAALALGRAFIEPGGLSISWRQRTESSQVEVWSLSDDKMDSGFGAESRSVSLEGQDLAVIVSVSADVQRAFAASREQLPEFRARLEVSKPGSYPHTLRNSGEAVDLARKVSRGTRQLRHDYPEAKMIHLFLAGPVGLSMFIGQLLNTVGPVQTYEHVEDSSTGTYQKAVLLGAS